MDKNKTVVIVSRAWIEAIMLNKSIEFFSEIEKYNKARIELELQFQGLPYPHTTLIKSLISLANPMTGIIESITYNDIANLLVVNTAPGRRNAGVLQKQTIRSYFRTIEQCCTKSFQIISEGQSLKIKFPTLPKIYSSYFDVENTDLYTGESTDLYTSKTLDSTGQCHVLENQLNTDKYTEVYTEPYIGTEPAKNNNIFNINKKQQHTTHTGFSISDDFYPSDKTIASALAKGFSSVTCPTQIKNFIDYNKARGSAWADYNPIFLKWLEQDLKRNTHSHSSQGESHGRYPNKQNKSKPTLQDVINANRDAVSPDGERYDDVLGWVVAEEIPSLALDTNVTNIRTAIY
jgi:hypothetical protein